MTQAESVQSSPSDLADGCARFERSEKCLPPIEIDELMICSGAGDVYHSWQCENTELRISLLEFLTQKTRSLLDAIPCGAFDRTDFIASGSQLIAQASSDCRLVARASLTGIAAPKNTAAFGSATSRLQPQSRIKTQQWYEARFQAPSLLAGTIQFADRTCLAHSHQPQFTSEGLDTLRRCVIESFQVLILQRFNAQRARWTFEHLVIESAQLSDSTAVALIFDRQTFGQDAPANEQQMTGFLSYDQA